MRFKRMRTNWVQRSYELLMLIILLLLNFGILPLQKPLGQVYATKNEEAFRQGVIERPICDQELQTKYCNAWYGGDVHTGCKYCGIGLHCPSKTPSGRGIKNQPLIRDEILRRHNLYREEVRLGKTNLPKTACIPDLRWDDELAEVAQIWADQCTGVMYQHHNSGNGSSDIYPKIFHERGFQRMTSRFHAKPGVGQNIAWALTKYVNFTKIIDDLWYRDIANIQPGYISDFQIHLHRKDHHLITQMIWGQTTHIGCGWTQFPLADNNKLIYNRLYPEGEYENFFVCNYGVGGNVPGQPVYNTNCQEEQDRKKEPNFEATSPASMKIDDLPKPMVDKYRNRFRNATENEKKIIETCLTALNCVVSEKIENISQDSIRSSCFDIERECITSSMGIPNSSGTDQNTGTNQDDNANEVSSQRLAITYLNGNKWSHDQRRKLLECKTENLLCQLPQTNENLSGIVALDPFEIDIRSAEEFLEEAGNLCVNELELCINGAIAIDDISGEQLENDVSNEPNLIDNTIMTTTRPVTITKSTSFIEKNQDNEISSIDPFSTTSKTIVTTESVSHMTGSTHMDIEVDVRGEVSTLGPESSSKTENENISQINIYDTVAPPNILKAELVSRNTLVVIFDTVIEGPKECTPPSNDKSRKTPRQISVDESCCQKVFKEPPFLNPYDKLVCTISEKTLSIKTRNGEDFLQGDDGYDRPNWNLYFLDDTGIVTKGENLNPSQVQFKGYAVAIDGVAEQYFTKDVQDENLKSFAEIVADLIAQTDKEERNNNELVVTMEKQVVLDNLRQLITFEFGKETHSEIYPLYVPNSKTSINLDSVIADFENSENEDTSKDLLITDIYVELVNYLEPSLQPVNDTASPSDKNVSPKIEHAKAVSRNTIIVQFESNIKASQECLRGTQFNIGNPNICCQIIFREKPLLKDNIDCFVEDAQLVIETKDGEDFWDNDDWVADWKLYFNVRNGIYIGDGPLAGNLKPLKAQSVSVEDIANFYFTKEVYIDNLKTLSGVIADMVLGSDKVKGTSTLTITFNKQPINGETKQVLTLKIYGEEASTVYPLDISSQTLQIELIDVIENSEDRDSLVLGIYSILAENLNDLLEPTANNRTSTAVPQHDINKNVDAWKSTLQGTDTGSRDKLDSPEDEILHDSTKTAAENLATEPENNGVTTVAPNEKQTKRNFDKESDGSVPTAQLPSKIITTIRNIDNDFDGIVETTPRIGLGIADKSSSKTPIASSVDKNELHTQMPPAENFATEPVINEVTTPAPNEKQTKRNFDKESGGRVSTAQTPSKIITTIRNIDNDIDRIEKTTSRHSAGIADKPSTSSPVRLPIDKNDLVKTTEQVTVDKATRIDVEPSSSKGSITLSPSIDDNERVAVTSVETSTRENTIVGTSDENTISLPVTSNPLKTTVSTKSTVSDPNSSDDENSTNDIVNEPNNDDNDGQSSSLESELNVDKMVPIEESSVNPSQQLGLDGSGDSPIQLFSDQPVQTNKTTTLDIPFSSTTDTTTVNFESSGLENEANVNPSNAPESESPIQEITSKTNIDFKDYSNAEQDQPSIEQTTNNAFITSTVAFKGSNSNEEDNESSKDIATQITKELSNAEVSAIENAATDIDHNNDLGKDIISAATQSSGSISSSSAGNDRFSTIKSTASPLETSSMQITEEPVSSISLAPNSDNDKSTSKPIIQQPFVGPSILSNENKDKGQNADTEIKPTKQFDLVSDISDTINVDDSISSGQEVNNFGEFGGSTIKDGNDSSSEVDLVPAVDIISSTQGSIFTSDSLTNEIGADVSHPTSSNLPVTLSPIDEQFSEQPNSISVSSSSDGIVTIENEDKQEVLSSTSSSVIKTTPKQIESSEISIFSTNPTTILPDGGRPSTVDPTNEDDVLDISFYNSTSKTSFRLAVCLEGINCEVDSEQCLLIHQKCNEMFNVSVIPFKVRKKLSECSVDDIICHVELNPIKLCENSFIQCTKIVVPAKYLSSLKLNKVDDSQATSPEGNIDSTIIGHNGTNSDDDFILELLGESLRNTTTQNETNLVDTGFPQVDNLTASILEAIGETLPGGIDITDLGVASQPIEELLGDEDTLPITNEVIFLIDENQPGNEVLSDENLNANNPIYNINLSNLTAVFNPQSVEAGTNNTILQELLKTAIVNKIKDQVHICNATKSCSGKKTEETHSSLKKPIQVESNTPISNNNDISVQLAICLSGVQCDDEQVCLIAQETCIGNKAFEAFNKTIRIAISECQVNHYLCLLEKGKTCERTKANCISSVVQSSNPSVVKNKYEDIIEKVADGITSMTSKNINEGTIYVEVQNDASDFPSDDRSEMIIVSKPVKNEPKITLTAIAEDIKFDLEGKNKLEVEIDTTDLINVESKEQKNVAKQRIKEALRKIIIFNPGHNTVIDKPNLHSVEDNDENNPNIEESVVSSNPESNGSKSSSSDINDNEKTAREQVKDLLIGGVKNIADLIEDKKTKIDVLKVIIDEDVERKVPEIVSSCCDKINEGSKIESKVHVKIPAKVQKTNIFNIDGGKISPKSNGLNDTSLNELQLRDILEDPLNVIETKDSIVAKDVISTSMVEEENHEPSKISISTAFGPFTSADLLQKEIKDSIVEGLKTVAQSNENGSKAANLLSITLHTNPSILNSLSDLTCCQKSQTGDDLIDVVFQIPGKNESTNSRKIPVTINQGTIEGLESITEELDSMLDNIAFNDSPVSKPGNSATDFDSDETSPLVSGSILPKIKITSSNPVNPSKPDKEFKRRLTDTLNDVIKSLVNHDSTSISSLEKAEVNISQNTEYFEPSVEVSCCETNDLDNTSTANVDVKLPSSKNTTNTFQLNDDQLKIDAEQPEQASIDKVELENLIKENLAAIDLSSESVITSIEKTNETSSTTENSSPNRLTYESSIPISLDEDVALTKENLIEETIENIKNIFELSPEGNVDTLRIKSEEGPTENQSTIKVTCCQIYADNPNGLSIDVTLSVPYEVEDSDNPLIVIPTEKVTEYAEPTLNSTALKKILIDNLDSSTLVEDLSSLAKPSLNTEDASHEKTTNINYRIPITQSANLKNKGESGGIDASSEQSNYDPNLETTLINIAHNLIDNQSNSNVDEIDISISQDPEQLKPFIDVTCCKTNSSNDRIKAQIEVNLPSDKKTTDTFQLSPIKTKEKNVPGPMNENHITSELEEIIKNNLDSIEINNKIKPSVPIAENELSVLQNSKDQQKPQTIDYEALIPITIEGMNKIKPKIVEETVSNIKNIIELSPPGLIDSLNIQARKNLANEGPMVNISCCSVKEGNDQKTVAIDVTIGLPYEVVDSDTTEIEIPVSSPKNDDTTEVDTVAVKNLLIELLDSSSLEEDLSSILTPQSGSNEKTIESPNIKIQIPIEVIDPKQEIKENIKHNIIQGVKDAIKTGIEDADIGKEIVRINAEKGPYIDSPIVQTYCCNKDEATDEKIIDVKVRLKSKDQDTINADIPLKKFASDSLQQPTELNETLFNQELDQHLNKVVENIDFGDEKIEDEPGNQSDQDLSNITQELSNDILNILQVNGVNSQNSLTGSSDKENNKTPSNLNQNMFTSQDEKTNENGNHNFQSFPPFKFNITVSTGQEPITAGEIPNNVNGNVPNILKPIIGLRPSSSLRPLEEQDTSQNGDQSGVDTKVGQELSSPTITPSQTSEPSNVDQESPSESSGLLARIRDVILALAATLMVQNISGGLPLGVGGPARKGDTNIRDEPAFGRPIIGGNRPFIVKDPNVRKTLQESNAFFDGTSLNFTIPVEEGEEEQLLDEAIRRNITELVASAFGNHGPGHQPQDLTPSGIEVQEVTVYVNNQSNEDIGEEIQNPSNVSKFPSKPISSSNENLDKGSSTVQNAPNAFNNLESNETRQSFTNPSTGKISVPSIPKGGQKTSDWYPIFDIATPSYIPINDPSVSYDEESVINYPPSTILNKAQPNKQNDERLVTKLVDIGSTGVITTAKYSERPFSSSDMITKTSTSNAQYDTPTKPTTQSSIDNSKNIEATQKNNDVFYYDFDDTSNSFNEILDKTQRPIKYDSKYVTDSPTYDYNSAKSHLVPTVPSFENDEIRSTDRNTISFGIEDAITQSPKVKSLTDQAKESTSQGGNEENNILSSLIAFQEEQTKKPLAENEGDRKLLVHVPNIHIELDGNLNDINDIQDGRDNVPKDIAFDYDNYVQNYEYIEPDNFDPKLIPNDRGASFANIVQATVVETSARSVRDPSIGIATISSITVGVIAFLAFGLLIFLALAARRRRLRREKDNILDSPNATPSQSRTTFNSSPPLGPFGGGDTPSAISGYGEISPQSLTTDGSLSPLTGGGSSSGLPSFPDPAVITPIDGHQTIISNFNEFMSLPLNDEGASRSNIMDSLPEPPDTGNSIAGTRNLPESSNYLFTP